MKTENLNEIYDSFKNLNVKDKYGNYGTGMGLSTVKKIVDKIHATINVSSEIHLGTTFTITLKKQYVKKKTIDSQKIDGFNLFFEF